MASRRGFIAALAGFFVWKRHAELFSCVVPRYTMGIEEYIRCYVWPRRSGLFGNRFGRALERTAHRNAVDERAFQEFLRAAFALPPRPKWLLMCDRFRRKFQ